MKKIMFLVALIVFFSCKENRLKLPSGSPQQVLPEDIYRQLSNKYDNIGDFEYGYALVNNGKYGIIDYKGNEVLSCIHDTIINLNLNTKVIKKGVKYGMVEYNGRKITELEYDSIKFNSTNNASIIAFLREKYWGILDFKGKTIVPFEYDDIPTIDINCAVIGQGGKYGMCDSIGNWIVEMKYDTIYYHYEESTISLIEQNRCIGIINSQNKVVTDCIYNCEYFTFRSISGRTPRIEAPHNGYIKMTKFQADAEKPKQYGLIECETGKEVIPFEYDDLGDYSEGLIWAEKDKKCGYIDIQNRVIIQFKYSMAYNFSEGLAAVGERDGYYNAVGGRWPNYRIGFIDKNDNTIIPFKFQPQFAGTIPEFHEGLAPMGVSSDNYWGFNIGYINKEGEFEIKPIYDSAAPFRNGLGRVTRKKGEGFVNKIGEEVIPLQYDYVYFENDTLIYCSKWDEDIKHYYSNHNGKIIKH